MSDTDGDNPSRARGRPLRGKRPSVVVSIRLTHEELSAVMARGRADSLTVSESIRAALNEWTGDHGTRWSKHTSSRQD